MHAYDMEMLRDFCDQQRIQLSSVGACSSHFDSIGYTESPDYRMLEMEHLCASLEEVLSFGTDRVTAAKAAKDVEGARMLLDCTRGLKALQGVRRD